MNTHIQIYKYKQFIYIHAYMHVCVCEHSPTHPRVHTHKTTHTQTHTHTHKRTHTYTNAHTHTHTHTLRLTVQASCAPFGARWGTTSCVGVWEKRIRSSLPHTCNAPQHTANAIFSLKHTHTCVRVCVREKKHVCCNVLQCVTVCCSVLQCVAVCV